MHILFVTQHLPCKSVYGDRLRSYRFIKELSKRHSISLITFVSSRTDLASLEEIKKFCNRIEIVEKKSNVVLLSLNILKSFSITPLRVLNWYSIEFKSSLEKLLNEENIDTVYITPIHMAIYLSLTKNRPTIVDFIDSKSLFLWRYLKNKFDLLWSMRILEMFQVYVYEKYVVKRVNVCIFSSDIDKQVICNKRDSGKCFVIPNPQEDIYLGVTNEDTGPKEPKSLIFTGNMTYSPNVDAVLFFCRKILPLIKGRIPNVKLFIVGKNPPKSIVKLCDKNKIMVTGYVKRIEPYLTRSMVFVSPLRYGSGAKYKIVEAMSMSLPVVATSLSNEGIWAVPNRDIFIANEPKEFAKHTIALLLDKHLRDKIASNGKKFVEKKYKQEDIVTQLEQVCLEAIKFYKH